MSHLDRTAARIRRHPFAPLSFAVLVAANAMTLFCPTVLAADKAAKGELTSRGKSATLKYAYLVKGPDAASKQTIRRLILSATDLGGRIQACKTMSCTDGNLGDGLSVNPDGGGPKVDVEFDAALVREVSAP